MNINNLSSAEFRSFGTVLGGRPRSEGITEEHRILESGQLMEKLRSEHPVYIDYDTGMTLLIVFGEHANFVFYVDRALMIKPNVTFSLVPLERSSRVTLLYDPGTVIKTVERFSVSDMEQKLPRLGFGNILTFFCQGSDTGFYFRGEAHAPYEFIYVESGQLHTIVSGHDYVMGSGECFIVGENEWHIQYSDSAVRFITVSFFADRNNMRELTDKLLCLSEKTKSDIAKMIHEKTEALFSTEYIEALFKIILIELIRSREQAFPAHITENELVEKALRYIDRNIGGKIVLSELASKLHISVPYLYELFSAHLHMPPGKYIMRIRIEESKILLREGKLTVGEIAKKVGFSNIQHFSKQFRNNCGMSPSQYMKGCKLS